MLALYSFSRGFYVHLHLFNKYICTMVYVFLANGFEDIEGLAPVDIYSRGGGVVKTVEKMGSV